MRTIKIIINNLFYITDFCSKIITLLPKAVPDRIEMLVSFHILFDKIVCLHCVTLGRSMGLMANVHSHIEGTRTGRDAEIPKPSNRRIGRKKKLIGVQNRVTHTKTTFP